MPAPLRSRFAVASIAVVMSGFGLIVPVAAQPGDPCAAASPAASLVATPGGMAVADGDAGVPTDAEAVLLALAIRQEQVVTALEIARSGDGALVDLGDDRLDEARDHLAAITALGSDDVPADPAQVVAVIDRLRQERDLPADAADLRVWEPGLADSVLCSASGADRDAATITLLRDASSAIVDLTGLAEPLLPEEGELLADIRDAAEARIDALANLPPPPATPGG